MMVAAALLLIAQSPPALAEAPPDQDIVVIGERLKKVRFKVKRDRKTGLGTCRITRSSGDAALDAMACGAAVACMGPDKVSGAAFFQCLNPRWKALIETRKEQLRASRSGS
jgi:hypothetical protein